MTGPADRESEHAWMDSAACLGAPVEFFYPEDQTQGSARTEARVFCAGCTVSAECLAYGFNDPHGIFGGTTPQQRRKMRRPDVKRAS